MTRRRTGGRTLREEDRLVWDKVARTVRPIADRGRALIMGFEDAEPAASNAPLRPDPPKKAGAPAALGSDPRHARSQTGTPADRGAERRFRRGHVEIDARFDLHGLTERKARARLLRFLEHRAADGDRTVLVITGKGVAPGALEARRHEPWDADARALPGVLRRRFSDWMAEPDFAALVGGYAPAHRRHGGAGAYYIVLR